MFKLSNKFARQLFNFNALRSNGQFCNQLLFLKTKYESDPSERNLDFSKLNADNFGDVHQKYSKNIDSIIEKIPDDPDGYDKLEIKRGIKISLPGYERIIDELYRKRPRDINKLLEVYQNMIYNDRYKPSPHIYTMLITACAQVGYTKKAFELFEEMKRYKLKPTKATITSLFNSCANCTEDKEYGRQIALNLKEQLDSDGYHFNITQYNSMIKTFALLNDMQNVNAIIKEMKKKRYQINFDTYSMLMMGCINDQQNGLYSAIPIMKNVLESNFKLNVSIFNLFLRCIRDCSLENEQNLLNLCSGEQSQFENTSKSKSIENNNECLSKKDNNQLVELNDKDQLPNLLTADNLNKIVSIDFESLSLPKNRFLLFGGLNGFLNLMQSHNIKPSLKTMTLIIDLVDDENCFDEMMKIMTKYKLEPDVCFYNVFLKKFAMNKNYQKCQDIIKHMQNERIRPDIMTFGAIAFSCRRKHEARKLLKEMNECNIIPNVPIIGSFINSACHHKDLDYVKFLLEYIDKNNLKMSNIDIEKIALLLDEYKKIIINLDRNNNKNVDLNTQNYNEVSSYFKKLIKHIKIEINPNSWSQFEKNQYVSPKDQYNSVIGYMKKKIDTKMNRENNQIIYDYDKDTDD